MIEDADQERSTLPVRRLSWCFSSTPHYSGVADKAEHTIICAHQATPFGRSIWPKNRKDGSDPDMLDKLQKHPNETVQYSVVHPS